MSTARRLALVIMVASALVALNAAAAQAQAGPGNPSGGTSLRQTRIEGWGSFSPAGWQSWLGTFAASRYASSVAGRTSDWRSLSAIVRRPATRR